MISYHISWERGPWFARVGDQDPLLVESPWTVVVEFVAACLVYASGTSGVHASLCGHSSYFGWHGSPISVPYRFDMFDPVLLLGGGPEHPIAEGPKVVHGAYTRRIESGHSPDCPSPGKGSIPVVASLRHPRYGCVYGECRRVSDC